jgi:hypothetical protein
MLSQAEAFAGRIFKDVGIETDWMPVSDSAKLDPSILTVQIFEARSKRADTRDAFGAAFITGTAQTSFLADVFFANIEEAATTRKEATVLLAHIMAHELGHLLLGAAHMPGTIMAESLSIRDVRRMLAGQVRFNQRQAERLCLTVSLRQHLAGRPAAQHYELARPGPMLCRTWRLEQQQPTTGSHFMPLRMSALALRMALGAEGRDLLRMVMRCRSPWQGSQRERQSGQEQRGS